MLEELLGSKSRARLVSLLVVTDGAPLHMRELARLSGGSISSVQRDVERLEAMGLLTSVVDVKGRRQVSLVPEHPFAKPLAGLVAADPRAQYGARAASIPAMERSIKETLGECVDAIVTGFDPVQIVLFGSYAQGMQRADSDLDLLVVLDEVGDDHQAAVDLRVALGRRPFPIDVIPTDPKRITESMKLVASVVRQAVEGGVTLYERPAH